MDKPKFLLPLATVLSLGLNSCATLDSPVSSSDNLTFSPNKSVAQNVIEIRQEILSNLNATSTGMQSDGFSAIECGKASNEANARDVAELRATVTLARHLSGNQNSRLFETYISGLRTHEIRAKNIKNNQVLACILMGQDSPFKELNEIYRQDNDIYKKIMGK